MLIVQGVIIGAHTVNRIAKVESIHLLGQVINEVTDFNVSVVRGGRVERRVVQLGSRVTVGGVVTFVTTVASAGGLTSQRIGVSRFLSAINELIERREFAVIDLVAAEGAS